MVFETQSTTVNAKAADPSRRLALGSCLGFVTAFFGWRIIRRYLARPTTKKVYTPPTLVPLDPATAIERVREAAAKGDTKAKVMLEHTVSRASDS